MFKAVRMLFQVLQEFVLISIPGSCPLKFLTPKRVVKCSECGLSVSEASLSWRLQGPFAEEMIFTVLILLRWKTFCRQLNKSRAPVEKLRCHPRQHVSRVSVLGRVPSPFTLSSLWLCVLPGGDQALKTLSFCTATPPPEMPFHLGKASYLAWYWIYSISFWYCVLN